jgi:hypothetical protein
MTNTILLLTLVLVTAVATATYRGLAGVRAKRRVAWELDRALWRHWISRP